MRICVVFQNGHVNGERIPSYPWSYVDALMDMGHEVESCAIPSLYARTTDREFDLILEIENGRNENGELRFEVAEHDFQGRPKTAILFVDSHGHPDLHAAVSRGYHHVFFAVWSRRDLFAGHPSAHWCPNATDLKWFGAERFAHITPEFDVGFFGSKKGLSRADDLVRICKANGWSYDVRQVASNRNPNRWPATGEAMARCRVLFNRGQKHDGPNQRVMESMAVGRPLLTDVDERDGMVRAFLREDIPHYYSYNDSVDLEAALRALLRDERLRRIVGAAGQYEVEAKHLIKHRAQQILEVIGA
jgi:hypothetical protein